EHPERQSGIAEIEQPALAGRDIDKRKLRDLRSDQPGLGADRPCIGHRMMVARQQEMVAVVDGEVGRRVEIGTATAARGLRGFVKAHEPTGIGEPHGGGKAGDSGADNVNSLLHQMKAYRKMIPSRVILLTRTGARGAANPRSSNKSRIAR